MCQKIICVQVHGLGNKSAVTSYNSEACNAALLLCFVLDMKCPHLFTSLEHSMHKLGEAKKG